MTAQDSVAYVAREMAGRRDALIGELVEMTRTRIDRLGFDWQLVKLLEASIAENIVSGLHYLANDTPLESVSAPTSAMSFARALAQRDVPLSALSRSYRIGHASFLDVALRRIAELPEPDRAPATAAIIARSMRFVDKVVMHVEVAYEQERDRLMSSRGGLKQTWIAQILDGSNDDLDAAEQALGYRFAGIHVAAEIWLDQTVPTRNAPAVFDEVARLLAPRLGAVAVPLIVPTGERQARMWFSVRDSRTIDGAALSAALEKRTKRARLAIGLPERGIDGFKRTITQADRVHLIATEGGPSLPRVLTYQRFAPLAMLANDLDAVRSFVTATLGALAADDPRNEWLRETLRIFLRRERSYSATAEEMGRHRNTIQYRVQQAIELCAGDLDDPDHAFDVQIALYATRWLGAAALGHTTGTPETGRAST
ncbi:PucR family transcriptional regulator [Skermania sp. ID1734]|uniref:PucR family transcriptional regulator n=1 Tax=Skermania sp. ID1734 TaxID=2597516 RepID=UPI00117DD669|nr:helix-turn-helix domain-containing protein [Skermania sp. ID1734]TSD99715.1 PucR family transcriptional regulator [Skermania sp. ID1734]